MRSATAPWSQWLLKNAKFLRVRAAKCELVVDQTGQSGARYMREGASRSRGRARATDVARELDQNVGHRHLFARSTALKRYRSQSDWKQGRYPDIACDPVVHEPAASRAARMASSAITSTVHTTSDL
jgi:hypothetical protein